MKLFKRLVVAAIAVAITAGTLVACKGSGSGDSEKTVTLNCYSQLANFEGIQPGWFGAILKNKFNVELNIIKESGTTYATRMEAGDLGDIVVWGSAGQQYQDAVAAGMLLDWEANGILDEYGKDIKETMNAALEHNRDISGGTIYGFGHNVATSSTDHEQFMYSWDLRYDYYEELGCPEIKDLDDLISVFEQMKANHPTDDDGKETYAISLWPDWDGNMVMYPKALATAYYGYDELGIGLYNCETGEFYDALMINDDGTYGPYIEMLEFFNKLYQKGLLDPDSNIQKYDQATAKILTGRTFWSIFNYAGSSIFNTEDNVKAGKAMYTVVPEEATPCVYGMNVLGGNRIWSIGSKTKYPEKCMEIINWMCTPDGTLEHTYGPQGLMWYYGDDGLTYFTELGKAAALDGTTEMKSDDEQYADYCGKKFKDGQQQINNTTWSVDATNPKTGERYNYKYWASEQVQPAADSIEARWREWAGADSSDEYLENRGKFMLSIGSGYTEGSKDADLDVIWKQVTKAIVEGSWKVIMSETDAEFEANLQSMMDLAKSYSDKNGNGYEQCVECSKNEAAARKAAEDEAVALNK